MTLPTEQIDLPEVLREVEAAFHAYEAALMDNDVEALNAFFWADPRTTRYGIADRQWGHAELVAYRQATPAPSFTRRLEHLRLMPSGPTMPWPRWSSCAATPRCAASRPRPGCGWPRAGASSAPTSA
jgi:hypothetical protein